jgi:hypothetical protein
MLARKEKVSRSNNVDSKPLRIRFQNATIKMIKPRAINAGAAKTRAKAIPIRKNSVW